MNGTFTVTVPEGTKQLVLAFSEVGDIDADSTLEVKAQLLDASGNPTHNEHVELTLTLDGEEEADYADAPGATNRTIRGDLEPEVGTGTLGADADGNLVGIQSDWRNVLVLAENRDADGKLLSAVVQYNRADDLNNLVRTATPAPDFSETLHDSAGADEIDAGGGGNVVLASLGGDDVIRSGSGVDLLVAGEGNDWVEAGGEADRVFGDPGNDRIKGEGGSDLLSGDISQDYLNSLGVDDLASTERAGEDVLEGGTGADILVGGRGRDALYAKAEQTLEAAIAEGETLTASGERGDWLTAGAEDDLLVGGEDNDALLAGSGDDVLVAGAGNDLIWADRGWIAASPEWTVTESFDAAANTITFTLPAGMSDRDPGAEGNDRIYAGAGEDTVIGAGGDDFVEAGSGNDRVWGEAGSDVVFGGAGNDRLSGDGGTNPAEQGDDFLDGEEGEDELIGGGGNDALYGGAGNDFVQGDVLGVVGGSDYLSGEAGNDRLSGSGGADVLVGGEGDDELFGDASDTPLAEQAADELYGGAGDDRLQGFGGNDTLDGGAGKDLLFGMADADTLIGGEGDDELYGENGTGVGAGGADNIAGGLGKDQILGEGGNDTIDGGEDDDLIGGNEGDDRIFGGSGADQIVGGEGNDLVRGEAGNDVILADAGADDIDGGLGNDWVQAGAGDDLVLGGEGEDTLQGEGDNDRLEGGAERDLVFGGDGQDFLDGGAGNDHLQGGAGIDTYAWDLGSGEDSVADDLNNLVRFGPGITRDFLSLGVGSLLIRVGGEDALHIEGFDAQNPYAGIGISELQFTDFDGNVVDTMSWSELIDRGFDLVGTPGPDTILGTSVADRVYGLEGNDVLTGNGGLDAIFGGAGDDAITGDEGDDRLFGDDGNDNLSGGAGNDAVSGDLGDDLIALGEGDDAADGGQGNDRIRGELGDDRVSGDAGADFLEGGEGVDTLDGGAGDDELAGDEGDDVLAGGEGADFLQGGAGADEVAGGAGDDTYVLDDALDQIVENAGEGQDTIVASFDYTIGGEIENLRLSGTENLAGTGNAADNRIFGNVGDNALLGLAGEDALFGGGGADTLDGGVGADLMAGAEGDDLYVVEDAGDTVAEMPDFYERTAAPDAFGRYGTLLASGGEDTVQAGVSFALGQFVENLVLTGTAAIDGTGTVEANTLQGNDADNTLYGYRLNGAADLFPTGVPFIQQFDLLRLRDTAEEMLADKANAAIYRGEASWHAPLEADLEPGQGDELLGMGGDDRLYGGLDHDSLFGGEGNDLLYGFAGADYLEGGAGDDTYVLSDYYQFSFGYLGGDSLGYSDLGASGDELIEEENAGIDTVIAEIDYALEDNFENLTLVADTRAYDPDGQVSRLRTTHGAPTYGVGNALDNIILGNDAGNELYGDGGADTLTGGAGSDYLDGGEGADRMEGGAGGDTYVVDDTGDLVIDTGGGIDEVYASIDTTLAANVENLYLTGETFTENLSGTGNALDNVILGNQGDNVLSGLAGNDTLAGGAGADAMTGGEGDDTYYVDSEFDATVENADEGRDLVYSAVSHELGVNLEDLVLTGGNGDFGYGNALANRITGDDSSNELIGFEGEDTLIGNMGDDLLDGGDGNDVLDAGEGIDELDGGAGDDSLQGGAGGDAMAGGAGDDIYYVDSDADSVSEFADEGLDTVFEENIFSYDIPEDVENTTVIGDYADLGENPEARWVIGNDLDNTIVGHDASNLLRGSGGADTIDARADNDNLFGDEGDDALYGGDDALRRRRIYIDSSGEEVPYWWYGAKPALANKFELARNTDRLEGGGGDDTLDGGSGDDLLYGEDGDDFLYGGDDGLLGDTIDEGGGGEEGPGTGGGTGETEDGRVFLRNQDLLEGGAGEDVLDGGSDDDRLYGGAGADTLYGGEDGPLNRGNRDLLDGGEGIDFMAGGSDDDQYIVEGSFVDTTGTVFDDCGEPVDDAPIRLWTTDLVVEDAGEGYDRVYSYADYTLPENVEALELAAFSYDGSALLRFGAGNALDNLISGNEFDNRLEGGGGNDTLFGNGGDDVLDGGAGDDTLIGGAGNDVYNLGPDGGRDVVLGGSGGFDTVHVIRDIPAADIVVTRQGDDVVLGLAGSGDRLTLAGWFDDPNRVQAVEFCEGDAWDEDTIADLANARIAPIAAFDDAASVAEDNVLSVAGNVLGNDTNDEPAGALRVSAPGSYAGLYGTLELAADGSYTYALANGSSAVQALAEGELVVDSFVYEASDLSGAYAGAVLEIEIAGANDAPDFGAGGGGAVVEDAGVVERFIDENLLFNGGFENALSSWRLNGNEDFAGTDFVSVDGRAFFSGATAEPALLVQEVETVPGERYLLEFFLRGGSSDGAEFAVHWNGETLLTVTDTGLADDYRRYQVELQGAGEESRLEFSLRNDPGFWHLDEVSLGLVEEEFIATEVHRAEGELLFTDVDATDAHALEVEPRGADYAGSLDAFIDADSFGGGTGAVGWEFTVENDEIQYLAEGETRAQVYDLTLTDPWGASATQSVTVTLRGANDAPEIEDSFAEAVEDEQLLAEGNVLEDAFDADEIDVLAVANAGSYAGAYGTLELGADGSFTYTLDNDAFAVQSLASGDAVEDAFEIAVTDGRETARAALFVEIDGTNDAPLAAVDAAAVAEDGALTAAGDVLGNDLDVDANSILFVANAGSHAGAFGMLTLAAGGGYQYALDNGAVQSLAEGETVADTFSYDVTDGLESATAALTVTVTGANDAPVAADITGAALEDGPAITLAPVFSDVDLADSHAVALVAYGNAGFEQGDLGGWETGNAALVQLIAEGAPLGERYAELRAGAGLDAYTTLARSFALAAGESLSGVAEFIAGDALPYDDDAYVTVRRLGGDTFTLFASSVSTVGDYGDSGWTPFEFVAPEAGTWVLEAGVRNGTDNTADSRLRLDGMEQLRAAPGVTPNADGTFGYNPGGRFEWLAAGESATDLLTVTVADDHGAMAFATATVSIAGANDAPRIGAAELAATVSEDNSLPAAATLGAGGSIAFGDVDLSDTHAVQVAALDSGSLGVLTAELAADSTGGFDGAAQWSFSVDNGALDHLGAGEALAQSYEVRIADGAGASDARIVTVTLAGVNDLPVAQDDAASVQEDATLSASGNVLANDSDIDGNTTLTVANAGIYGSLSLAPDGSYTYTLDNASAAVQGLRAGEVVADSFTYLASDGIASTPGTLAVSVLGSNDAPVAQDDAGAAQEDGPPVTLLGASLLANDTDVDAGDTKTLGSVSNSVAGAQVTLVGGDVVYTVGGLFQMLGAGATAADSFSYTMLDGASAESTATVTMTIAGANDAPLLAHAIPDQDASAGTPWSFAFAANTFTDIDAGDLLAYAATQGDGSALPAWLAFDAATRTFSGTAPGTPGGGGGGDDCGCGEGGGAPSALDLRVVATDTAGASAEDAFTLNIAGGGGSGIVPIVGTDGDDVLAGTPGNDVIDGREGYDRMAGGAGNDVYYVDETCDRVDLVTEEAGAGHDTVYSQADYTLAANLEELHLVGGRDLEGKGNAADNILVGNTGNNKLQGEAGNDLLLDDAGRDRLEGGAGDDVLDGGRGDDRLLGGAGNDLYVYSRGGGEDRVEDSGGMDAVRFGEGIAPGEVSVRRDGQDLRLRLADDNGSLTLKDWFASSAKRVEEVRFADGTAWNEAQIRARLITGGGSHGGGGDDGGECGDWGDEDRRRGRGRGHEEADDGWDGHHGGRHDHKDHHHGTGEDCEEDCGTDTLRDAIGARLRRNPAYDFTALTEYLARNAGGGYGAMSAGQIAAQWRAVQNCVGSLAKADEDDCRGGAGHGGWGRWGGGDDEDREGRGHHGWGHGGSTGRARAWGGMDAFCGLGEGFRKL